MAVWGWNDIKGNENLWAVPVPENGNHISHSAKELLVRRIVGAILCAIFIAIIAYFAWIPMNRFQGANRSVQTPIP